MKKNKDVSLTMGFRKHLSASFCSSAGNDLRNGNKSAASFTITIDFIDVLRRDS